MSLPGNPALQDSLLRDIIRKKCSTGRYSNDERKEILL